MAGNADSSLESKSSEELKQMLVEQTSALETPSIEEVKAEELPSQTIQTPTEEIPLQTKETTQETKREEVKEGKTRILKVEGKEVEIPEDKVLDYAQKGYHYEQKMAQVKTQREELERLKATAKETAPSIAQPQYTPEQIKEELIKRLNDDPAGTLFDMMNARSNFEKEQTKQERIADLQFEIEKEENAPHWASIKPKYERFRLLGESRETAFLKAENDYFRSAFVTAKTQGIEEGLKKAKLKEAADMPGGEKKTTTVVQPTMPSDAQIAKMSASELAAMLPRREVED